MPLPRFLCLLMGHSWAPEVEIDNGYVWETQVCRVCKREELVYAGRA